MVLRWLSDSLSQKQKTMNNTENEKVYRVVRKAIESFNEQLPADRKLVPLPDCKLVGSPNLDSADIVNLLVLVEQGVEDELGVRVSLFDGQTVEQGIENFVTVEALVKFLAGSLASDKSQ